MIQFNINLKHYEKDKHNLMQLNIIIPSLVPQVCSDFNFDVSIQNDTECVLLVVSLDFNNLHHIRIGIHEPRAGCADYLTILVT